MKNEIKRKHEIMNKNQKLISKHTIVINDYSNFHDKSNDNRKIKE